MEWILSPGATGHTSPLKKQALTDARGAGRDASSRRSSTPALTSGLPQTRLCFWWHYLTQPPLCSVSSWHSPCVYVSISSSNVDTSHDNFRAQASPLWPPSYGVLHLQNTFSNEAKFRDSKDQKRLSGIFLRDAIHLKHLSEWAQRTEKRLSFSHQLTSWC